MMEQGLSLWAARGEVWWLDPDLTARWQRRMEFPACAAAMDSFGQYAAVCDQKGWLRVYNRLGDVVFLLSSPRPLLHLAFAPETARLFASADYGLVACFDLTGRWLWRDGLVSHVGGLAVRGDGDLLLLAGFSDGLHCYRGDGQKVPPVSVGEACARAVMSFDGDRLLAAGMNHRLMLLDTTGQTLTMQTFEKSITAIALSALGDVAFVGAGEIQALRIA